MPNEIPDSDEESEYESGPRKDVLPTVQTDLTHLSPSVSDRDLGVNFDDFISQTQSVKEGVPQLEETRRSTASTQKHLRDALDHRRGSAGSSCDGVDDVETNAGSVLPLSSSTTPRKRAHSEVMYGKHRASNQGRSKRTKTYSSSSRRLASSHDIGEVHEDDEATNREHMPFPSAFAARSSSQAPDEQDEDEDDLVGAKNRPRRVVSLINKSNHAVGHVLSTSNSSIGGYQSINLDFRGSGPGSDMANPFGTLSQVSIDHLAEQQRADLSSTVPLSASPRRPDRDVISPLMDEFPSRSTLLDGVSVDPSAPTFELPDKTQMLNSPIVTIPAVVAAAKLTTGLSHNLPGENGEGHTETIVTTKKHARKSESSGQSSIRSMQDERREQDTSHNSAIGLPKEQCKPRASKSRSVIVEPERHLQVDETEPLASKKDRKRFIDSASKAAEHSSPAKLPTSELNLSDEAAIGLPKENYKPRPSRRRSRMIAQDDSRTEAGPGFAEVGKQPEQSPNDQHTQSTEGEPALTPKAKRGKKAKVKRAKTSAAGLSTKSEPMISDGEEDVVWMDTKPARVKLDLSTDFLASKKVKDEDAADVPTVNPGQATQKFGKEARRSAEASLAAQKTITIEIPPRVEKEPSEPKKRGRKRKKTAESLEDNETAPEPEELPLTSTPGPEPLPAPPTKPIEGTKIVLSEKSTNTSLPPPIHTKTSTTSSSPTKLGKITHSPINPSGGKVLYRVGLSRKSAIPPLLKMVKPPVKQQQQGKENFDGNGKPVDLVETTMKKWRELGVLD